MEECIFCKIARGEIESEVIHETENVVSFLDVNPRAPGHTLVIPKDHVEGLTDLEDKLVGEVFSVVKKVEEMLSSALDPDAFTVGINDGKVAGQEIPHMHVNVIPRFGDDGGKSIHSVVNNPAEREISEIASEVRKASDG